MAEDVASCRPPSVCSLTPNAQAYSRQSAKRAVGVDVPHDDAQAVAWTRKAVQQGYAEAQYSLGQMYHIGQGVPQDAVQAASWFRKAAE